MINQQHTEHIESDIRLHLTKLRDDRFKLKYPASEIIESLHQKAETHGIQSLTAVELYWINSLVTEMVTNSLRERIAQNLSSVGMSLSGGY